MHKKSGFTLTELIAVLIIIILIVMILFPVFSKRHEHSGPSCSSYEKQIGLGFMQYVQDNDDTMPLRSTKEGTTVVSWRKSLFPYIKSTGVYKCPDNPVRNVPDLEKDGYTRSYAVNATSPTVNTLGGPFADRKKPLKIKDISDPRIVIAIVESTASFNDFNLLNPIAFTQSTNANYDAGYLFAGHHGRTNVLLIDCHVKCLKPLDTVSYNGVENNGNNNNTNLWSIDGKPFNSVDMAVASTVLNYAANADKE